MEVNYTEELDIQSFVKAFKVIMEQYLRRELVLGS